MFQLTEQEAASLRSQFATLKTGRGEHRKYRPYAFTEHGAVMLASVLNSPIAVQASVQVVRAFIRLRELLVTHKDLARKLTELEKKYDAQFKVVFDAIRQLMTPPPEPQRPRMDFHVRSKDQASGDSCSEYGVVDDPHSGQRSWAAPVRL